MDGFLQPPQQMQQQPVETEHPMEEQSQPVAPSTADQKDDYAVFVSLGLELMSSPKTRRSVETLLQGPDPLRALANALVVIITKVSTASRIRGIEVHDHVKMFASYELMKRLVQIGQAAKIFGEIGDEQIEAAYALGVQNFIKSEIAAGRIDQDKLRESLNAGVEAMDPKQQGDLKASVGRLEQSTQKYFGKRGQ